MFTHGDQPEDELRGLLPKVVNKDFRLVVIGLGRVGLPLAVSFALAGIKTLGVDVDEKLVKLVDEGKAPFYEEGLSEALKTVVGNGYLSAISDVNNVVSYGDVFIVAVGTPLTENNYPDYTQLISALKSLARPELRGKLVIIRSTIAPGTLENVAKPLLEMSGLRAGVNFGLVVVPERIAEGKALHEIRTLPEVIGGINEISSQIAAALFRHLNPGKKLIITRPIVAELAKLFLNVYRYVNFALANEFALIAEQYGADAREVIRIANEDYPRGGIPMPGFSGGPCLSKDGYYLLQKNIFPEFITMAWRLNEHLPQYVANRVVETIRKLGLDIFRVNIGVLGLAYKKDIDDVRYSPSKKLVEHLKKLGLRVLVHDPYIRNTLPLNQVLKNSHAIIIAVNHSQFMNIEDIINKHINVVLVYDVWGIINRRKLRSDIKYLALGAPYE
jgi:UDP-N-acetyl-D-mannosaminuronic acid dehydrogenase